MEVEVDGHAGEGVRMRVKVKKMDGLPTGQSTLGSMWDGTLN